MPNIVKNRFRAYRKYTLTSVLGVGNVLVSHLTSNCSVCEIHFPFKAWCNSDCLLKLWYKNGFA